MLLFLKPSNVPKAFKLLSFSSVSKLNANSSSSCVDMAVMHTLVYEKVSSWCNSDPPTPLLIILHQSQWKVTFSRSVYEHFQLPWLVNTNLSEILTIKMQSPFYS